jgi:hypothetical protein
MKLKQFCESFENTKRNSRAVERETMHDKVEALVKEYDYYIAVQHNLREVEFPKYKDAYFANNPDAKESGFMNSTEGKTYDLKSRDINTKLNILLSRLHIAKDNLQKLGGQI